MTVIQIPRTILSTNIHKPMTSRLTCKVESTREPTSDFACERSVWGGGNNFINADYLTIAGVDRFEEVEL